MSTGAPFEVSAKSPSQSYSDLAPGLCSDVIKLPRKAGAHCQASTTALPQATLPVLAPRPQQTHHAEHADTAVQVFPTVQALEKTNTRASLACDRCRKQKAKCDETKPCTACKRKGTECKYRDTVSKATDKAQADILEIIGSVHTTLGSVIRYLGQFEGRLNEMESLLLGSPSVTNGASTDPANFIATPVPQRSPSDAS
ncbi:hypothetical protein FOQG_14629 [Fusarium oxysporum f. sp. raphani 54005]|uniref:Zn(2)-C6 fungal-type domain-containing protein n=2 Tax=Fusarium oxysporum TaxID=5507 RepID=X0CE03_FUSOX|nr:hypothetical protein FOMG_17111 [Fusarium oxysporum f. sp. melonis 26406]EXK80857.1 hypothetical protein FOQG_14629 [Fusarium oxysporum f. sp. raphani 54005]